MAGWLQAYSMVAKANKNTIFKNALCKMWSYSVLQSGTPIFTHLQVYRSWGLQHFYTLSCVIVPSLSAPLSHIGIMSCRVPDGMTGNRKPGITPESIWWLCKSVKISITTCYRGKYWSFAGCFDLPGNNRSYYLAVKGLLSTKSRVSI